MKVSKIALSAVASLCVATTVSAMEFQVLGAKAASMGGAGIAMSPSSIAAYNNPALLANNPEKFSLHIGGGVGIKDTGAFNAASDLNDLGLTKLMDQIDGHADNTSYATAENVQKLQRARDIVIGMDKEGAALTPTADFALSFGSFGIGAFLVSDIGVVSHVDQQRTKLIFQREDGQYYDFDTINIYSTDAEYKAQSLQYAVENGSTYLDVTGLAVAEIPLAYGHAFSTDYGSIGIGGALKLMSGQTFFQRIDIDSDNAFDNIDNSTQRSSSVGLDLGLTFKPDALNGLTLAMVGKNLNTPSFDVTPLAQSKGIGDYELEPMFRVGAAYKFNDWVELALDADITENKSVTEYNTQYIGGGANFDLSILELNVGLMKNMASNDVAGMVYTAGVATGPDWLHFELSAQMASKTITVENQDYPSQVSVNFALSSAW